MRDQEAQTTAAMTSPLTVRREGSSGFEGLIGRGKYKLWALSAIILLAVWSMFTGSVTLKWSGVDLNHLSHDSDDSIHADLDVLDVDEREKMVRQMWDVYKRSSVLTLSSFWREAFGAAYQDLISEVASVRDTALLEIAKMSFRSQDVFYSPQVESTGGASKAQVQPRIPMKKTRKQK